MLLNDISLGSPRLNSISDNAVFRCAPASCMTLFGVRSSVAPALRAIGVAEVTTATWLCAGKSQGLANARFEPGEGLAREFEPSFDPRGDHHDVTVPPGTVRRGFRIRHVPLQFFVLKAKLLVFNGEKGTDAGVNFIQIEFAPARVDHGIGVAAAHCSHDLLSRCDLAVQFTRDERVEMNAAGAEPGSEGPGLLPAQRGEIVIKQTRSRLPVANQGDQPARVANPPAMSSTCNTSLRRRIKV